MAVRKTAQSAPASPHVRAGDATKENAKASPSDPETDGTSQRDRKGLSQRLSIYPQLHEQSRYKEDTR